MKRMMFKAWILASSRSLEELAKSKRNFKVLLRSKGSLEIGSALRIAIIVGGIPAERLKMVLKFSVVMLSKA